jgi:hypothetical protein
MKLDNFTLDNEFDECANAEAWLGTLCRLKIKAEPFVGFTSGYCLLKLGFIYELRTFKLTLLQNRNDKLESRAVETLPIKQPHCGHY